MRYFLSDTCSLKWLETPSVYNMKTDELYDLDDESFEFLTECSSVNGGRSDSRDFTDYCLEEGILVIEGVHGRRPPLIKSPCPSLRYIELQITDMCNLDCRHCYIGEKEKAELSVDVIKKVLQEFEQMQGLRLLITGGEPLMHSCFGEINDILPAFSFRKALFTNGTLLERENVEGLNVDEVQISIDGLEDSHDLVRGRGTFRAAVDAAKSCLDRGLAVSVSTMVHPTNLNDFDAMEKLFISMGVRDWTVDVPCMAGNMQSNKELMVSPGEGGRYLTYGYGGGIHAGEPGFGCGLHLMAVSSKGRASKCTFYSDSPAGSLAEGLATCWQKIAPIRLSELRCDCAHLEHCRGGCRYRAESLEGPLGRDLYRCSMYDIIELHDGPA